MRELSHHVDKAGNIRVHVLIGRGNDPSEIGSNAKPATVANFLRELADDLDSLTEG